uniref:GATA transcription factor 16 n=1 Tax=Erigeron canadensis TaxID=72917 RepID=UPI001CB96420|nr:GATA transcription factor 16 [Erigeron canadensis]
MVDLSDKGGSEGEEDMGSRKKEEEEKGAVGSIESDGCNDIRTCVDCGTTKSPLWRGGPAGPKTLCNACGIRSRKKRRALSGGTKDEKKQKKTTTNISATNTCGGNSQTGGLTISRRDYMGDLCLKKKLMALGKEVVLQRPRSTIRKQRKIGEEEQAALLLMALSCGSAYA